MSGKLPEYVQSQNSNCFQLSPRRLFQKSRWRRSAILKIIITIKMVLFYLFIQYYAVILKIPKSYFKVV